MGFCKAHDCIGSAHKDGLCRAHYERKRRGADMRPEIKPKLGTWRSVNEAILDVATADTDAEYRAATDRHRRAVDAWRMPAWKRRMGKG